MVHTPRRSSLIRPVPGVSLILVSGLCSRADRCCSRFNGLRLGFGLGAAVATATPGAEFGKLRAPAGPSGGMDHLGVDTSRRLFPKNFATGLDFLGLGSTLLPSNLISFEHDKVNYNTKRFLREIPSQSG